MLTANILTFVILLEAKEIAAQMEGKEIAAQIEKIIYIHNCFCSPNINSGPRC